MKVKFATQTLNRHVADELLYLKNDTNKSKGMPEFKDCEPIANFLLGMNNLFDILNSLNLLSKDLSLRRSMKDLRDFHEFFLV